MHASRRRRAQQDEHHEDYDDDKCSGGLPTNERFAAMNQTRGNEDKRIDGPSTLSLSVPPPNALVVILGTRIDPKHTRLWTPLTVAPVTTISLSVHA
ncbi:hypothetical protein SPRG_19432, partial [Saprolegnia parasitica CBS 223.65]